MSVPPWLIGSSPLPDPSSANADGIVAVGGHLSVARLYEAYGKGHFPWPHADLPMLWFSPDPRFVIPLPEATAPKSLLKKMKSTQLRITLDAAFERVIPALRTRASSGQEGTWITQEIIDAYLAMHRAGYAHSVEAWSGDELVGGLYGVSLGGCFFGESMFALQPEASKIAYATFMAQLKRWKFDLVDCQVYTEHLARFGGRFMPRSHYVEALRNSQQRSATKGPWQLDMTPADARDFLKKA